MLNISGRMPDTYQEQLKAGWNSIGWVRDTEEQVEEGLKPFKLGSDYTCVLRYNRENGKWQEYSALKKEFNKLKPGEGYFIKMSKDKQWNIDNAASAESIAEFSYDYSGSRVKRKMKDAGGVTRETIYIDSLYEIQGSGDGVQGTVKHIFAGANRICSIESGSQTPEPRTLYYHPDHLGSSNIITDATGALVQHIEYTPYGSIASTDPRTPTPVPRYLYTGKELDNATNLYYYGARYYAHSIGRFIQPDPLIQDAYDPQTLNHYAYCRNNPLNLVDPTGNAYGSSSTLGASGLNNAWDDFWGSTSSGISNFGSSINSVATNAFQTGRDFWGINNTGGFWQGVGSSIFNGVVTGSCFVLAAPLMPATFFSSSVSMGLGYTLGGISGAGLGVSTAAAITGKDIFGNRLSEYQRGEFSGSAVMGWGLLGVGAVNQYQQTVGLFGIYKSPFVYRQGTFENGQWKGNFIKGTKWALEHPLATPNFSQKYGLPLENSGKPDWVVGGYLQSRYTTGSAPSSHNNSINTGGSLEVIIDNSNDVVLDWFHML